MTSLLEHYIKYHTDRTDAEESFAKIQCLQMIGQLAGYHCYNNLAPSCIHHNTYVVLMGMSSRSRKSVSQNLARWMFPDDMCHPEESSPEQMIVELSQHPERMIWYGEWSSMLKCIGGSHYLSRIAEIMNHIFDCPKTYTRTLRQKKNEETKFEVKNPHLSFSTTCTEEMVLKYIDEEMVHGGFFARFIMVYGEPKNDKRKILSIAQKEHAGKIKHIFYKLSKLCPFHAEAVFELTDKALERHHEIELEMENYEGVGSFVGRYSNYIVSFADLLMISDKIGPYVDNPEELENKNSLKDLFELDDNKIKVSKEYIDMAWEILKPHLKYTQTIVQMVKESKPVAKLWSYLEKYGKTTYSNAMRNTNLNSNEMKLAVDTLERQDRINVDDEITKSTTNREYRTRFIIPKTR